MSVQGPCAIAQMIAEFHYEKLRVNTGSMPLTKEKYVTRHRASFIPLAKDIIALIRVEEELP